MSLCCIDYCRYCFDYVVRLLLNLPEGAHALYQNSRPSCTCPQAALAGGSSAEQAALQSRLAAAVGNLRRLAAWHALQAGLTQAGDYAGAVMAYCCVALAIFSGAHFEVAYDL